MNRRQFIAIVAAAVPGTFLVSGGNDGVWVAEVPKPTEGWEDFRFVVTNASLGMASTLGWHAYYRGRQYGDYIEYDEPLDKQVIEEVQRIQKTQAGCVLAALRGEDVLTALMRDYD